MAISVSKSMKVEAIRAMLVDTRQGELSSLLSKRTILSHTCYNEWFGNDVEIFRKAPEGWFASYESTNARVSGMGVHLHFKISDTYGINLAGSYFSFPISSEINLPKTLRFPYMFKMNVNEDDKCFPSFNQLFEVQRQIDDLREELQILANRSLSLISNCRTMSSIEKTWPEIVKYFPKKAKQSLPSVDVVSLNKKLGLPKGKN